MSGRTGIWRAVGESVIGLTHQRDGRSCQDAIRLHDTTPGVVVVAIADGHGQAKSFRSQQGSRIAVDVAVDVLLAFAQSEAVGFDGASRLRDLAAHLPRVVAQTWREQVWEHVEQHRFSVEELAWLDDRFPIDPEPRMSPDAYRALWRAYGTTLLAVLVTGPYSLALQIGDGLLMAAGLSGGAFEVLDPDALNFGTSTTSLSDEDAELRLRWRLIPHEGDYPILYWLCTDGYEKAFRSDDIAKVCLEYRDAFRERDGWRSIQQNLAEGLHQASARGTGDDATAAFLFFEEEDMGGARGSDSVAAVPAGDEGRNDVAGGNVSAGMPGSDSGLMQSESITAAKASGDSTTCGEEGPVVWRDRYLTDSPDEFGTNRDSGAEGGAA